MPPDDKDTAVLPRENRWILGADSSAHDELGAHMWISYSPDLRHWGRHRLMLEARRGAWWTRTRLVVAAAARDPRGWLVFYHGVRHTPSGCLYRLGLALFDLERPRNAYSRGFVDLWAGGRI